MVKVYDYIGIYDDCIEYYCVKILAKTREEANNKFINFVKERITYSKFDKECMYVVPIFAIDTI